MRKKFTSWGSRGSKELPCWGRGRWTERDTERETHTHTEGQSAPCKLRAPVTAGHEVSSGANWKPGSRMHTQPFCRACPVRSGAEEELSPKGDGHMALFGGVEHLAVLCVAGYGVGDPCLTDFFPPRTPPGTTECTDWPSRSSPLLSSPSCPFSSKVIGLEPTLRPPSCYWFLRLSACPPSPL